jgi:lipoprotein-anchoring transpeptidase ErfK/SrfK
MNKSTTIQKNLLYAALVVTLICAVVAVAAWTTTSTPAMGLNSTATTTHSKYFAFVQIAKPTYTPLPTITSSPTAIPSPTIQPSNTPEAVVVAKIVADAPYQYSASNQAPASTYGGNKYILVDISEQHMYVYEGDALVYSFVASTGMHNATRTGTFSVLDKIPNAYGATWDIWMPNWLGIYYAGSMENGIHALPILPNGATLWAGYLGVPISYGCVVLGTYEAQLLYDWVDVGTPVVIQW